MYNRTYHQCVDDKVIKKICPREEPDAISDETFMKIQTKMLGDDQHTRERMQNTFGFTLRKK